MDAKGRESEPACIDDEIPFEIPDGWEWARLSSLGEVVGGGTPKTNDAFLWADKDEGIAWLTPADMKFVKSVYVEEGARFISQKGLNGSSAQLMPANSVLMSSRAPIGYIAISKNPISTNQGFKSLVPQLKRLAPWVYWALQGQIDDIKRRATGTTFKEISGAEFSQTLIPIPPLAEQRRIAERVSGLMPLVEEYGKFEAEREALDAALPDRLRKSVLQMAVEGKLVPQDPSDEPASALLERIREERAKLIKEKKIKAPKGGESVIYLGSDGRRYEKRIDARGRESESVCIDDEIPFEVPRGWEWVRLESACAFGQCVNIELANVQPGTWMLDLEDIEKETGAVIRKKRMGSETKGSTKHLFASGMVLYSKLRPYLNKVVIADERGVCTSEILPLDFGEINARFAQIYLMSSGFLQFAKERSYGVKMPRLGTGDGKLALMPIPPLAEQRRIVDRVNSALASID